MDKFFDLLVLVLMLRYGQSCSVFNHTDMTTKEFLSASDIIVFGKEINRVYRTDETLTGMKNKTVIDSQLEVMCILKHSNASSVDLQITVDHIAPRSDCSVSFREMEIGKEMIFALTTNEKGRYTLHEVNPMQPAVFEPTRSTFSIISQISETSNWQKPSKAQMDMCYFINDYFPYSDDGFDDGFEDFDYPKVNANFTERVPGHQEPMTFPEPEPTKLPGKELNANFTERMSAQPEPITFSEPEPTKSSNKESVNSTSTKNSQEPKAGASVENGASNTSLQICTTLLISTFLSVLGFRYDVS